MRIRKDYPLKRPTKTRWIIQQWTHNGGLKWQTKN